MSIIEDLQESLGTTRKSVDKVVEDLQGYSQVKNSLQSADQSIRESSGNLDALAESLKVSIQSLNAVTENLGKVTDLVQQSDPGFMLDAQKRIEAQISNMDEKLKQLSDQSSASAQLIDKLAISQRFDQVNQKVTDIEKTVSRGSDAVTQGISEEVQPIRTIVTGMAGKFPLLIVGLVVVIGMLVVALSRLP